MNLWRFVGKSEAKSNIFMKSNFVIVVLSARKVSGFQRSSHIIPSYASAFHSGHIWPEVSNKYQAFRKEAELSCGLFIENSFYAEFSQNKMTTLFIDGIDSTHKERVGRPSGLTGVSYDNHLWLGPVWKSIIVKPVLPPTVIWVRLGPDIPQSQSKLLK